MDDGRFLKACQLQDDGKFKEAIDEFLTIAEDTEDPVDKAGVDKAGVYLNAATTLKVLGEYEQGRSLLGVARSLLASSHTLQLESDRDVEVLVLEMRLDFDEADFLSHEGKIEEALAKFDLLLKKYGQTMQEAEFRATYEMTQARRAFILADLGRCKEALPILEEAESFKGRKAETRFYLGHCYLANDNYSKAMGRLLEALRIGLYQRLEYRAHCELGIVYFTLKDYEQAKLEFEKCAETADEEYMQQAQIWKWLENTSRVLGLKEEADRYSKLTMSS